MATKLTFARGEKTLLALISGPLAGLGFTHLRDLLFGRRVSPECLQRIAFGARHGKGGEFCTSFGVGVRFDSVEALLPPGDEPFSVTVALPLSVLDRTAPGFPQWCFDGTREPADLVNEIVSTIVRLGLPFLEQYSSLEVVRRNLLSEVPRNWFILTPEERIMALAAIEYSEGRTEGAIQLVHAALKDREDALPSKRTGLQQLLKRLEAKPP